MVSTAFFLSSQMSALADCLAYRRRWMDDHEELSALPNYHMRQEDRETASTYKFKPSCTGPSIDACSTSSHMLIDGSVTGLPHSDVGHLLAATFDASSSSTTASLHISMDTHFVPLKFGNCIKICFYSYFMYKKQNSTRKCDGKCTAIITINE